MLKSLFFTVMLPQYKMSKLQQAYHLHLYVKLYMTHMIIMCFIINLYSHPLGGPHPTNPLLLITSTSTLQRYIYVHVMILQ